MGAPGGPRRPQAAPGSSRESQEAPVGSKQGKASGIYTLIGNRLASWVPIVSVNFKIQLIRVVDAAHISLAQPWPAWRSPAQLGAGHHLVFWPARRIFG